GRSDRHAPGTPHAAPRKLPPDAPLPGGRTRRGPRAPPSPTGRGTACHSGPCAPGGARADRRCHCVLPRACAGLRSRPGALRPRPDPLPLPLPCSGGAGLPHCTCQRLPRSAGTRGSPGTDVTHTFVNGSNTKVITDPTSADLVSAIVNQLAKLVEVCRDQC